MQVVTHTPGELVVHDGRWHTVFFGALLFSLGGGALWVVSAHPEDGRGSPWVAYVVGVVFVLGGLLVFWLSADRRVVVDKSSRTVSLVVQRLVHRQATLLACNDIDDVVLEESPGMMTQQNSRSAPTYRVAFAMKDGTRVPWTPYLTGDRLSQETCAAAVREFGGWAHEAGRSATPVAPPPALVAHPAATNWGCLAAFFSVFIAIGIGMFCVEAYRVVMWKPVAATVNSTGIETVPGTKGGNTYAPYVDYTYSFNGIEHRWNGVLPMKVSAGRAWAESLAGKFHEGAVTTAYVDPANPARAFLIPHLSLIPLIFVAIPLFFGLLFAWIIRRQRAQVAFAGKALVPVVQTA